MVRTKADGGGSGAGRRAVAAKAPRKVLAATSGVGPGLGSPAGKEGKYAGGNPVCPRPTPEWQKGIGAFLKKKPRKESDDDDDAPCTVTTASVHESAEDKENDVVRLDPDKDDVTPGGSRDEEAADEEQPGTSS